MADFPLKTSAQPVLGRGAGTLHLNSTTFWGGGAKFDDADAIESTGAVAIVEISRGSLLMLHPVHENTTVKCWNYKQRVPLVIWLLSIHIAEGYITKYRSLRLWVALSCPQPSNSLQITML